MVKTSVVLLIIVGFFFKGSSQEHSSENTIENIQYLLEKNLLTKDESRREEINIQLKNLKTAPSENSFQFNISAFQCYSHVLAQNIDQANHLISELEKSVANDNRKQLLVAVIKARIYLLQEQVNAAIQIIDSSLYRPLTLSDSIVQYYAALTMADAYERIYHAEAFLRWNKIALGHKEKCLSNYVTYKDYRTLAIAYERNELVDSSYLWLTNALKMVQEQKDSVGLFVINMDLGIFLSEKGDRAGGLEFFSVAEKYEMAASKFMQAAFHINCNIDFRKVGHFEIARKHLEKAEDLALEIGDTAMLGRVYQNWVAQYGMTEQLDKIPAILKKSEALLRASKDEYGLGHLLIDKGHYYDNIGDLDSALYWYDQASLSFKKIENDRGLQAVNVERFITLMNFEEYDRAQSLGLAALEMAKLFNDQADIMDIKKGLAEIYYKKGAYKKAYDYYFQSSAIKDTLEGIDAARQVNVLRLKSEEAKRLTLELEHEKNESALLLAHEELKVNKMWNYILFGAILLSVVFLVIVFWMFRKSRKLNQKLIKLDKQKDDLMHVVAHDLLSPIGKVGALVELLRIAESEREKEEYMDYLDSVVVESSSMVQNLMDIHAFESDKISLLKQKFVLGELVEDSLIALRMRAERKKITIKEDVDREAEILADARLIKRILDNLVGNAIKFCPPKATVSIRAKVEGSKLLLTVADDGPGFSAIDQKNAFKKFSRLSARPTGEESSTGLGLAIVKELVSQLNGKINLSSEKDKGATFSIEIPLD